MTDMDRAIEEAKKVLLPYESWERLTGESSAAFAAFCAFRDVGPERNIRKAVETVEADEAVRMKRYRVWRNWSMQYKWRERAGDYDRYTEQLKQAELRKTVEAQGEKQREVTGKMLDLASKKIDTMRPADLPHGLVSEWVQTASKLEREAAGLVTGSGRPEMKQGDFFDPDFSGL